MVKIMPEPKETKLYSESKARLDAALYTYNPAWQKYADVLKNAVNTIYELELEAKAGGIELIEDTAIQAGHYILDSSEGLKLKASDDEGINCALASALQLIEHKDGELFVPRVHIEDYPDKDYRGFMLDLGRKWHTFDKLLKYVDLCFLYKIKYFNVHFTDTNLYTLPSNAFPELPKKNMHYTFEQIEYLNEYAKNRGVVIIPEFECPGHAPQLNKAYPEVFADEFDEGITTQFYTETGALVDVHDIICAGSERAWEGTKTLIKEICDMFPDAPYINIGGDEANIKLWNHCSVCRDYMEKHGISDEYELYSEYIARVTDYVFTLGKTPIVWEGFPKKGCEKINKDTIVIAWESHYHLANDLIDAGFRIINSSWQPLYVVPSTVERWGVTDILAWNVYNWQHWWENSAAHLNPINLQPTEQVLGAMLCAWEMNYEQEISFVMENLAAVSERVWTVERVSDDKKFRKKLDNALFVASALIQDR